MELTEILLPEATVQVDKVSSKKRLLQDASRIAHEVYGLPTDDIFAALMARETLGPTAMGNGVAIPHARLPQISKVCGVFIKLDTPLDFEAIDRQPVDLVFVLFAPEAAVTNHLKALARVSRTLRDQATCAKLRSTDDHSALYSILTEGIRSKAA